MLVARISEDKASQLIGGEFKEGEKFHPTQDKFDNWFISLTEAQFLKLGEFEVIEFEPKEVEELE